MTENAYYAIDPMALILSGRAYLIWVEIHNPRVPLTQIKEAIRAMTAEEQKVALARAQTLSTYGKAVEDAIVDLQKEKAI